MNILPKKRWHVRTKDNIARVRRDEAKAAAEEKALQERVQLAEQEARTAFLREQASYNRPVPSHSSEHESLSSTSTALVPFPTDKHINLFNEVAEGQKSWGINKDREAEKKEEQEKYEKNIGYLTYLGQTSLDNKGEQPWYEKSHSKRFITDDKNQSQDEVAKKSKNLMDPLKDIQKYLELSGKKPTDSKSSSTKAKVPESPKPDSTVKKVKKHKSKKKKRKHNHSSDESSDDEDKEKAQKLQQLRAERLRRENEERNRSEKLLAKLRGDIDPESKKGTAPVRDGDQGYNSQFNPHLAKKPKVDKNVY